MTTPDQRKEHNRKYYYESGGKDRVVARNKANIQRNREYVKAIKESSSCTDCGISYPYYVMQFDHVTNKEAGISRMVGDGYSIKRLDEEIAKCELVCANCHMERTQSRRTHGSVVSTVNISAS